MYLKFISAVMVTLLTLIPSLAQTASDPTIIEYGQDAEVVFPANAPDLELSFTGTAGDIVVVEVFGDPDELFSFFAGEVIITNERGTTLADSGDIENTLSGLQTGSFTKTSVAAEILGDGVHSIIIEPSEYLPMTEDTDIIVRLTLVPVVELDEAIAGEVSGTKDGYHAVVSAEPFEVAFSRGRGNVALSVYVSRLDSGVLESLAELSGEAMLSGTVVVEPNRVRLHLIRVAKDALVFTSGSAAADYKLTVSAAE